MGGCTDIQEAVGVWFERGSHPGPRGVYLATGKVLEAFSWRLISSHACERV